MLKVRLKVKKALFAFPSQQNIKQNKTKGFKIIISKIK